MRRILAMLFGLVSIATAAFAAQAQQPPPGPPPPISVLRVYLDCWQCDINYGAIQKGHK